MGAKFNGFDANAFLRNVETVNLTNEGPVARFFTATRVPTVELLEAGHQVVILDNLCNASCVVFNRIEQITGNAPIFIQGDIRNSAILDLVL